MYFGGLNGIVTFYPEMLLDNPYTPKPYIVNLRLSGKVVNPDDGTKILKYDISETSKIELSSSQTNL